MAFIVVLAEDAMPCVEEEDVAIEDETSDLGVTVSFCEKSHQTGELARKASPC